MAGSVEECVICSDELGVESAAVQLPCGHVFCRSCLEQWARNSHKHCPQCRTPYQRSKLRELKPWHGGLRLKDQSKEETAALQALEEAKAARALMEKRAAAAEKRLRQEQRVSQVQPQMLSRQPPPTQPPLMPPSFMPPPLGLLAAPACAPVAVEQRPSVPSSALTDEQRQRAAANRAAALERKRERDAAGATRAAARAAGDGCENTAPTSYGNPGPSTTRLER